jgi:hypothetical protein
MKTLLISNYKQQPLDGKKIMQDMDPLPLLPDIKARLCVSVTWFHVTTRKILDLNTWKFCFEMCITSTTCEEHDTMKLRIWPCQRIYFSSFLISNPNMDLLGCPCENKLYYSTRLSRNAKCNSRLA